MEEQSTIYVPLDEGFGSSVWCADAGLTLITNVSEQTASGMAEFYPEHFYFFAELTTDVTNDDIVHRDATSGKFVSEAYVEQHPDTTVTEKD